MTRALLRISPEDCGIGHDLICPGCGSINLHHNRVEVYDRDREDADTGRKVVLDANETSITRDMKGNPSARRDGMRIHFDCECCSTLSALTIVQHKGTTYLEMHITGENPDFDQLA